MQRYNDAIEKGATPLIPDILNLVFEYAGTTLKIGSLIDCLDSHGLWFEAEIIEIKMESLNSKDLDSKNLAVVQVHFIDWYDSDNEWVKLDRIAPLYNYIVKADLDQYDSNATKAVFPSYVPKTDEERVQNVPRVLKDIVGKECVMTRKEEGTSTTFIFYRSGKKQSGDKEEVIEEQKENSKELLEEHYNKDEQKEAKENQQDANQQDEAQLNEKNEKFLICGRNFVLLENNKNTVHYFAIEKQFDIGNKMKALGKNLAVQGEIVGPKINGNKMGLNALDFKVFNIWDIDNACYLVWAEVESICKRLNLNTVPVLYHGTFPESLASVNALLESANILEYKPGFPAEGLVCKTDYGKEQPRHSFKVISNAFLLKHNL